jgi:2-amino-4-hydroxy-6-hydroxymethyldihydropteridine diphosphokinase
VQSTTLAYIGAGANLGNAAAALNSACASLAALPLTTWVATSSIYRSAPIDAAGADYLNAVVSLHTALAPHRLLAELQAIELAHGRQRFYRNAPRTLDLDLLLYGDQHFVTPTLTVPHPRAHERAFVLAPLAQIAPELVIPGWGRVSALLASVAGQRIEKISA